MCVCAFVRLCHCMLLLASLSPSLSLPPSFPLSPFIFSPLLLPNSSLVFRLLLLHITARLAACVCKIPLAWYLCLYMDLDRRRQPTAQFPALMLPALHVYLSAASASSERMCPVNLSHFHRLPLILSLASLLSFPLSFVFVAEATSKSILLSSFLSVMTDEAETVSHPILLIPSFLLLVCLSACVHGPSSLWAFF